MQIEDCHFQEQASTNFNFDMHFLKVFEKDSQLRLNIHYNLIFYYCGISGWLIILF